MSLMATRGCVLNTNAVAPIGHAACVPPCAGDTAQQSTGRSELMGPDLAAADDFVNELASSEAPGCRLPVLTQLLQCPATPDAIKVCHHLAATTSSALSTNPASSCVRQQISLPAYE